MKGIFQYRKAASKSCRSRAALRLWQVWPLWLIMGAFLVLGVGAVLRSSRSSRAHQDDVREIQLAAGQDLRLARQDLDDGQWRLFSYPAPGGRRLRFVVQRTADGTVHAAIASCKACYRSERPHYLAQGQVMCGMCNHPMHRLDEKGLSEAQKRCALVAVPHSSKGNQVLVSASAVLEQMRALEAK